MLVVNSLLKPPSGGGLGDFIRGSLGCLKICNKLGYDFTIFLKNHPVGKHFKPSQYDTPFIYDKPFNCVSETLDLFQKYHKPEELMVFLKNQNRIIRRNRGNDVLSICTNLLIDDFKITNEERSFVSSFFEFNEETRKRVSFELIDNNVEYECIHIRCGDYIAFNICNNHFKDEDKEVFKVFEKLENEIIQILNNTSKPVVLISDSESIRDELSKKLNLVSPKTNTYHSAFRKHNCIDMLKDLHILRNCTKIYQLTNSFHWWGSGFSQIASRLDNIPIIHLKY
jgi:hypothetical protein